jgi:hypothetical protein
MGSMPSFVIIFFIIVLIVFIVLFLNNLEAIARSKCMKSVGYFCDSLKGVQWFGSMSNTRRIVRVLSLNREQNKDKVVHYKRKIRNNGRNTEYELLNTNNNETEGDENDDYLQDYEIDEMDAFSLDFNQNKDKNNQQQLLNSTQNSQRQNIPDFVVDADLIEIENNRRHERTESSNNIFTTVSPSPSDDDMITI